MLPIRASKLPMLTLRLRSWSFTRLFRFHRCAVGGSVLALFALLSLSAAVLPPAAAAAGSISGTVTDAVTKAPVKGLVVCASLSSGAAGVHCATTDAGGDYTIELSPGSYFVQFDGWPLNYGGQSYDHKDWWNGDSVAVNTDPILGIDAKMEPFGRIEGSVRGEGSGTPVGDTRVCAWKFEGNGSGLCARTDASGAYVIADVPPEKYVVEFWPMSSNHLWQAYDHKEYWDDADPVSVALSEVVTGIDADVSPGAGVEGVVRRADNGGPFAGTFINFWPLDKETFWPARPDGDGSFSKIGIPPGKYKVEFLPYSPKWETQFWNNKATWEEAETISLVAGTITTGIEAEMEQKLPEQPPSPSLLGPSVFPPLAQAAELEHRAAPLRRARWTVVSEARNALRLGIRVPYCSYREAELAIERVDRRHSLGGLVFTVFIHSPSPDLKSEGCAEEGLLLRRWVRIGKKAKLRPLFDGSTSPPSRRHLPQRDIS